MKNIVNKKNIDGKNKSLGVFSIVLLIFLGILALYYFYADRPPLINGQDNTNLPVEGASALMQGHVDVDHQ